MMTARISEKHTLHIDQMGPAGPGVQVPWSGKVPGTWIAWVLEEGKLVDRAWSEVGFGTYEESSKRAAYDKLVGVLRALGRLNTPFPFEDLIWET